MLITFVSLGIGGFFAINSMNMLGKNKVIGLISLGLIIASVVSAIVSYMQGENDYFDSIIIIAIVVLNAIQRQIGDYHDKLDIYHEEISLKLNDGLTDEERCNKGEEVLNSILNMLYSRNLVLF